MSRQHHDGQIVTATISRWRGAWRIIHLVCRSSHNCWPMRRTGALENVCASRPEPGERRADGLGLVLYTPHALGVVINAFKASRTLCLPDERRTLQWWVEACQRSGHVAVTGQQVVVWDWRDPLMHWCWARWRAVAGSGRYRLFRQPRVRLPWVLPITLQGSSTRIRLEREFTSVLGVTWDWHSDRR